VTAGEPLHKQHPLLSTVILRKVKSLRFWVRVWLGRGALPNALIIGAAKAGTTSLFDWLSQHPQVAPSRIKEVKFFDHNFSRGPNWYRAQFSPQRHHKLILEASPSYLWNVPVPGRVRALLGAPKLIVLLREPVDRAYSHYAMKVRQGFETLSFEDALEAEPQRLAALADRAASGGEAFLGPQERFAYLAESRYHEQIERWLAVFPKDQLLFIRSEDLFRDPAAVLANTQAFLGLAPFDFPDLQPKNVGTYLPLDPKLRGRLERQLGPGNRRLAELTGVSW
jgi:hypothetical protein